MKVPTFRQIQTKDASTVEAHSWRSVILRGLFHNQSSTQEPTLINTLSLKILVTLSISGITN
jgi:hypothetical protein